MIENEGAVRPATAANDVHAVFITIGRSPFVKDGLQSRVVCIVNGRTSDQDVVASTAIGFVPAVAADEELRPKRATSLSWPSPPSNRSSSTAGRTTNLTTQHHPLLTADDCSTAST